MSGHDDQHSFGAVGELSGCWETGNRGRRALVRDTFLGMS